VSNVIAEIGGDPFQATDRNRLVFHSPAPAGRLAGTVADAPEYRRKDIRSSVQEVGVRIAALCGHTDVFRDIRVRRASPLAVYDPMVKVWV
jgi:hypothetical protein